jgi:DNA-binding transcriptional MerR regulator
MSQEFLTLKEIARRLDVPESNIRYYRDRFDDFLPSIGEGRKRRYLPEALDIFRFIVERYKEDRSTEEVGHELMRRFPRQARVEPESHDAAVPAMRQSSEDGQAVTDLLHRQARTMERLSEILVARHETGDDQVHQLQEEQAKLKKALLLLWKKRGHAADGWQQPEKDRLAAVEQQLAEMQTRLDRIESEHKDMEERFTVALDRLQRQLDMCSSLMDKPSMQSNQES